MLTGVMSAKRWIRKLRLPVKTGKNKKTKKPDGSIVWAPISLQMVIAAMKLKDTYSLKGKL